MITICTNNEHNRSHLISAIIDAGQTEAQAELLCETDEEDIWIDVFMSVDMSPFGSYNVSRHFSEIGMAGSTTDEVSEQVSSTVMSVRMRQMKK